MGCSNSPRCGKGVREPASAPNTNFNISYQDPNVILLGASKCPVCGSRLKLTTRPTPHWRCVANSHRWRSA